MRRICLYVWMGDAAPRDVLMAPTNPGIGGTTFSSLRLATLLARTSGIPAVVVVTDRPADQFDRAGLDRLSFEPWDSWRAGPGDCVVVPAGQLHAPDTLRGVAGAGRVVVWSHHPFDREVRRRRALPRVDGVVSPGAFATASNRLLGLPATHIPHTTDPADERPRRPREAGAPFDIVFMSAGLAIKGVADALDIWRRVRRAVPEARLHIIGRHPAAASAPDLRDDLAQGRILLHGELGLEKLDLLRTCHAGIVNPRGLTESWCLTAFEMMGRGVPIVSSGRHGMYESMRHLPELRAPTLAGLARRVIGLAEDPERWQALSDRCRRVVAEAHADDPLIAERWARIAGIVPPATEAAGVDLDLRRPLWPLRRAPFRVAVAAAELVQYRLVLRRRWR